MEYHILITPEEDPVLIPVSRLSARVAHRAGFLLLAVLLLGLLPALASAQDAPPTAPVVARVYYADKATINEIGAKLDVWTVAAKEGYAVVLLQPDEYARLAAKGLRIEVDPALTSQLSAPRGESAAPLAGIPGYACYRTVEETYDSLASLAAAHPNLLTWTDTGDSWEKVKPGGAAGYDLYTMVLTNKSTPGPKPKFYLMAAIHAREYATAELGARYVEKLVADYGFDPDTTWLIDHYELHAVFQVNPDGRKKAESGLSWRKNTDNDDGCTQERVAQGYYYGTDLNRNSSFKWDTGGSDDNSCGQTYHGPSPASEPETQHVEQYMASLFGDHRGPGDTDPAPLDTAGVMITLHSYGNSVLYPWGWLDTQVAPNDTQLKTLGRKFGFYNNFEVCQAADCYYIASGGTDDYAYGTLGIPGYTFEVGTSFFQDCATFENDILPRNLPALKYAFKAARQPYRDPAGPEPHTVALSSGTVTRGAGVTLTSKADDTRYNSNGYGTEPSQNIVAARYSIDMPSWKDGALFPMAAADGAFNSGAEDVTAMIDTTALAPGKHIVFVEAQDANGQWGVPSAAFLTVNSPCSAPLSPTDVTETVSANQAHLTLAWTHLAANDRYEVWRSDNPYFAPGDPGSVKVQDVSLSGSAALSFTATDVVGDPSAGYYLVRGANSCGATAAPAARSGEISFELVR